MGREQVERTTAGAKAFEHIRSLHAEYLAQPSDELALRLRALRREAAEAVPPGPREPWPPAYPDPFPGLAGRLPEITPDRLDCATVAGAVAHHGAVIVRGLLGPDDADRGADAIRRVTAAREADPEGGSAWYAPLETGRRDAMLRSVVAEQGGTWMADSPHATERFLDALWRTGIVDAFAEHFGEPPLFSLQKSTLRCSPPVTNLVAWHQDGSFLGDGVRTMNVWVAFSPCGGDRPTPGLEVLPRRVEEILPTDTAFVRAAIPFETVAELARETPTVVPEFDPGDALVFDERFLHRTHLPEGMTHERLALECWFFAPSNPAERYLPLAA